MPFDDASELVLMVQNSHTVFCYFKVSPMTVKLFEDKYGENSWRNSKQALKVYEVSNGKSIEIKTILIDAFADNWYINLEHDDKDIYVKLGRILPDDTFAAFAVSNTVTTPRSSKSSDESTFFVDVSKTYENTPYAFPASVGSHESDKREIKPYPFIDGKKK